MASAVEPVIRVLCLHGAFVNQAVLKFGLAPLTKAARARAGSKRIDFIFEDGPLIVSAKMAPAWAQDTANKDVKPQDNVLLGGQRRQRCARRP